MERNRITRVNCLCRHLDTQLGPYADAQEDNRRKQSSRTLLNGLSFATNFLWYIGQWHRFSSTQSGDNISSQKYTRTTFSTLELDELGSVLVYIFCRLQQHNKRIFREI